MKNEQRVRSSLVLSWMYENSSCS